MAPKNTLNRQAHTYKKFNGVQLEEFLIPLRNKKKNYYS
jgi:hypothetical protein